MNRRDFLGKFKALAALPAVAALAKAAEPKPKPRVRPGDTLYLPGSERGVYTVPPDGRLSVKWNARAAEPVGEWERLTRVAFDGFLSANMVDMWPPPPEWFFVCPESVAREIAGWWTAVEREAYRGSRFGYRVWFYRAPTGVSDPQTRYSDVRVLAHPAYERVHPGALGDLYGFSKGHLFYQFRLPAPRDEGLVKKKTFAFVDLSPRTLDEWEEWVVARESPPLTREMFDRFLGSVETRADEQA